jgi:Fe2+ or Zn2+ uptake regulation protein
MGESVDKYVALLKSHHLKVTYQRLRILEYIDHHRNHPTADTIYTVLRKDNPSLSRTTVYNTLDILTDAGIVHRLTICPTEHRYDITQEMHHHFICKECHRIYDIDFSCPNVASIKEKAFAQGHEIQEIEGIVKGLCHDCRQKKNGGS